MRFQRLHPDHAVVAAAHALDGLAPGADAPEDRPRVLVNFVVSADGRARTRGVSAPLSDAGDRELFHGLRGQVDAVLAGTGTLEKEGYGRLVRDPARRAAREARGLAPDPLAVVLTRSGDVPDVKLVRDPDQPSVVLTGADAEPHAALRTLRTEHGVRSVLCEGGPTIFRGLLDAGVVDELFLTVSPQLTAGEMFGLLAGPALEPLRRLELVWVLEHEGTLFLRYAL